MKFEMNVGNVPEKKSETRETTIGEQMPEEVLGKLDQALNRVGAGLDNLDIIINKDWSDDGDQIKVEELKVSLNELATEDADVDSIICSIIDAYENF